jgi:hypothetical protein
MSGKGAKVQFFKRISIFFITIFIILAITYGTRVSIVNSALKEQLSLVEVEITCLDFRLTSSLSFVADKLCLQTPKADIEVVDMAVHWQLSPQMALTDINIKLVNITGTEHLISKYDNTAPLLFTNNQNISQLLQTTLKPYIEQIKQFRLATNIKVTELSYIPFVASGRQKTSDLVAQQRNHPYYSASLSAANNTFSFSLQNAEKIEFVKAQLTKSQNNSLKGFSIELSAKLDLLKSFVSTLRLPLTTEIQNSMNANVISGNFNTAIAYQTDVLSMKAQLTDFTVTSDNSIGGGALKIFGALNLEGNFPLLTNEADSNNAEIALTFVGENKLSLEYGQPHFLAMLEKSKISPAIFTILKNNPLTHLSLTPQNNTTLSLNDKQVKLSAIEINANGDERAHHIQLKNISFALPAHNAENSSDGDERSSAKKPHTVAIENFIIDSELTLTEIAKYTKAPVSLHLEGSIDKTKTQTELNLANNSSITAKNIIIAKQQNAKQNIAATASKATKNKALVSMKVLTVKLAGKVQQLADNTLNVNLNAHSRASQVNIPKALQVKSFDLVSDINGNLDDISINAHASADGIKLGSMVITGAALSPKVIIAANSLQLTDLLSLNIQLPVEIELIEGNLDYAVSGQLLDFSKVEDTPFNVSVAVRSASGEVDGIWLQELNWQQHFTMLAGKITTVPTAAENLTIDLIETPTPISKLSINTNWTFNKSFQLSVNKLKANVLGGSFSIPKIHWPFEHGHSVNVQLKSIDLEQVLALDKKQGIVVTGNISGQLPVSFDGDKYIIEAGELYNINNGLIQVTDNPAVAELKASNSQLQLAFDALQNLHYHQLSSAVSMADDGYMLLETVIKGRNPDIDNDVNLNLNLSYDLLGLLESLSITQRFEEGIIKGLQKNKE